MVFAMRGKGGAVVSSSSCRATQSRTVPPASAYLGAARKFSDDEVKAKLDEIFAMYEKTEAGINEYKATL